MFFPGSDDLCWDGPETFSLRKSEPEYPFWGYFFSLANPQWLEEFDRRTKGSGSSYEFIYWDFMSGVTASSKGAQYQQALAITKNFISESEDMTQSQLGQLEDKASAVFAHRRRQWEWHGADPHNVHKTILDLWGQLVETTRTKAGR